MYHTDVKAQARSKGEQKMLSLGFPSMRPIAHSFYLLNTHFQGLPMFSLDSQIQEPYCESSQSHSKSKGEIIFIEHLLYGRCTLKGLQK